MFSVIICLLWYLGRFCVKLVHYKNELMFPLYSGTLMEEAMILPCGHSFGSDGIQQVIRMVSFQGKL